MVDTTTGYLVRMEKLEFGEQMSDWPLWLHANGYIGESRQARMGWSSAKEAKAGLRVHERNSAIHAKFKLTIVKVVTTEEKVEELLNVDE